MARSDDDDSSGSRPVLTGLAALALVSLLVGGLVSAIALGAAKMSGLGGAAAGGPTQAPSLYIPEGRPTTTPEAFPDPSDYEPPSPSESSSPSDPPTSAARSRAITLQVFPTRVSPGERINFTGVYPTGEGAVLQVQRFENGWTDFPVSANVSGGLYNTFILTSRTGKARFRVVDHALDRASNAVTVTIG